MGIVRELRIRPPACRVSGWDHIGWEGLLPTAIV